MPKKTNKHQIRSSNQDRNIIYPSIRGIIARTSTKSRGGDLPEEINLRQFRADLPKDLKKKLWKLLDGGELKLAYQLACDYVVEYFLDDSRTYSWKHFDHGKWVEITLNLSTHK